MEQLLESKEVTLVTKSVEVLKDFIEKYTSMMKDLIISLIGKTSYNKIEKAVKAIKKLLLGGISKLSEKKIRIVIGLLISTLGYIAIVNRKLITLLSKNASNFIKTLGKMTLEILSVIKNIAPTFFKNIISFSSDIVIGGEGLSKNLLNSFKSNVIFELPLFKLISVGKSAIKIAYYNSKLKKYTKGISLLRDKKLSINSMTSKNYDTSISYNQNMDKAISKAL